MATRKNRRPKPGGSLAKRARQDKGSRSTCGKFGYPTRKLARNQASRTVDDRDDPYSRIRPFECERCDFFHIGHTPIEVINGVVSAEEWFGLRDSKGKGVGALITSCRSQLIEASGGFVRFERAGEAWGVTIVGAGAARVTLAGFPDVASLTAAALARYEHIPRPAGCPHGSA